MSLNKHRSGICLTVDQKTHCLPSWIQHGYIGDLSDCRSENALPAIMDTACYSLLTLRKLLLRAGDIEVNPGPSRTDTRTDLCNYTP